MGKLRIRTLIRKNMSDDQPIEDDSSEIDQAQQEVNEALLITHQESFEVQSIQTEILPDPSVLSEYELVLPGLPDRIVNMVEEEAKHRRKMQSKLTNLAFLRSFAGLITGFVFALLVLGIAVWLIQKEQYIPGIFIASFDVASITAAFVVGKNGRS